MNLYTLGLCFTACIASFALGMSVMIIASMRYERKQEEDELEYMLRLHNEEVSK